MPSVYMMKVQGNNLAPATERDAEKIKKLKYMKAVKMTWVYVRNYKFLQKFIMLVEYAFENWEPTRMEDPRWKNLVVEKNEDQFREDLIIMAGFYTAGYRLDGSVRLRAKSISFANMDQEEFEKVYTKVFDVVWDGIFKSTYTKEELDRVLNEMMGFMP